jgi:lipoprotein-releasing system ATP-binding protein
MIKANNIQKSFGILKVLRGIELSINKGEIISVVGASGAGKSTLLHILGTLDKPDSGTVLINEVNVSKLNDKKLSAFRNQHIGFVFQFHHLLPEFDAMENICIPSLIAGTQKKAAMEKAGRLAVFLGLSERLHHKPSELSGGEQQRVAVARALINEPFVVFADEPSGNLDSNNARELHKLFFKLRDQFQQTFVIVTHNQELANLADRKLTISDGVILNGFAQ